MAKRQALGKGLGSLIPTGDENLSPDEGLRQVPVSAISPNPHQPRSNMDDVKLKELADSIRAHGLIQPLVVRQDRDGRYTLIAGERRLRAAQRAGLSEVPVIIKEATSQTMLEIALVENIQRDDLNPLEEALAYQQLISDFGLTQEEVANKVGKSRPTVANMVRLLNLPENIQHAVIEERISGAHARALLPLADPTLQTVLMETTIRHNLSVRQVEHLTTVRGLELAEKIKLAVYEGLITPEHATILVSLTTPESQLAVLNSIIKQRLDVEQTRAIVDKMLSGKKPSRPLRQHRTLAPEILDLQSQFSESLGFDVDIQQSAKGGKVIIHFYSLEDLEAIYQMVTKNE